MKKVFSIFLFAGMLLLYACGPNTGENAEKARQDSAAFQDSINAAQAAIEAVRANTMVDTSKIIIDTSVKK